MTKNAFQGVTELTLVPHRDDLLHVRLNAINVIIKGVVINGIHDAIQVFCLDPAMITETSLHSTRSLKQLLTYTSNIDQEGYTECGKGELFLGFPSQLKVSKDKPMKIAIEFSVTNSKNGLHFVCPTQKDDVELLDHPHMYVCTRGATARQWMPCVDAYNAPCTWDLKFTVPCCFTALSSGELKSLVETENQRAFHYEIKTPVSAPNIAFVVGSFQEYSPGTASLSFYCLPKMTELLQNTVRRVAEVYDSLKITLKFLHPFHCLRLVFVDELSCDAISYSSLILLSLNLQYPSAVVEQRFDTFEVISAALGQQFFGCYMLPKSPADEWITNGCARFLHSQALTSVLGSPFYHDWVSSEMSAVMKYEQKFGKILLAHARDKYLPQFVHQLSPKYLKICTTRAFLVFRVIEQKIGLGTLLEVLSVLLNSSTSSKIHLILSLESLLSTIQRVSRLNVSAFIEEWVFVGGHVDITISQICNSQRNAVKLQITQNTNEKGTKLFKGSLKILVQESDGFSSHCISVLAKSCSRTILCQSRARKNMSRKVQLWSGHEVEIDISQLGCVPILWIGPDPNIPIIGRIHIEQTEVQWQLQLLYERSVLGQFRAIEALKKHPTVASQWALITTIKNDQIFHKVRTLAAQCLTEISNNCLLNLNEVPILHDLFWNLYSDKKCRRLVQQNDFSYTQNYILQKGIITSLGHSRTIYNESHPDVSLFLLNLIKFNDNSRNKFADGSYKAAIIDALSNTLTPVAEISQHSNDRKYVFKLTPILRNILEVVVQNLTLDNKLVSYKCRVSIACLKVIRKFQSLGYIPPLWSIFKVYSTSDLNVDLRVASLECLVDFIQVHKSGTALDFVLSVLENDQCLMTRLSLAKILTQNPPFTCRQRIDVLNTSVFRNRLWRLLISTLHQDKILGGYLVELYQTLYGFTSTEDDSFVV